MSLAKEFKEFAMKGNVVDLAVGVIIGGAFGKIVSALVEKILMPPLGLLIGNMDFSQLRVILKTAGADGKGEVAIGYGDFIQTLINFVIIAFCLFLVIKVMNRLKRLEEGLEKPADASVAAPPVPEDILLLREIRDSLKNRDEVSL